MSKILEAKKEFKNKKLLKKKIFSKKERCQMQYV